MIDFIITKLAVPAVLVALLCSVMGVSIGADGQIDVSNSFVTKSANQSANCITEVQKCMKNPPSVEFFNMKIG